MKNATTKAKTYNGYTNYETWNVNLWLSNDEGTYRACTDMASAVKARAERIEQVRSGIWTEAQAARFTLADELKDMVTDAMPDLPASMFSDLLTAALSEVNWNEIADTFLED